MSLVVSVAKSVEGKMSMKVVVEVKVHSIGVTEVVKDEITG